MSNPTTERDLLPAVILLVDAGGTDIPAAARVRRMLKAALRGYHLRCTEIRRPTQEEAKNSASNSQEDRT